MIRVYPASDRYQVDYGWLQSAYSFSFADYYDPDNIGFGPMRVFNDDCVHPERGFGPHPHKEMEIVTLVLSGILKHEDSKGNYGVSSFGSVQRMSAGNGIFHSEMNPSKEENVELLQMWFRPERPHLPPSYEHTQYNLAAINNELLPIVTRVPEQEKVAHIHQDLTIYLSDLEEGNHISFSQRAGRRIFLFVIEGKLMVNSTVLERRDVARITEVSDVKLTGCSKSTRFLLIDLP